MALKQRQNEKTTVMTSQLLANVMNAISEYGKNEDLAVSIAVICTLVIFVGVAMMSATIMVSAAVILIVSLVPVMYNWVKEDYNREI